MTTTPVSLGQDLDVARLFTRFERLVVQRLSDALNADDATVEEWRVLSFLADDVGHAMSEIADYAMLPPPSLTKLIDRMVTVNLVLRRPDTTDRRRVLVFLTDRGRSTLAQWTATVRQERDELARTVGGEEVSLMAALLSRASARIG